MRRDIRARIRAGIVAVVTSVAIASMAGASFVMGQAALEPSDVVLVFDVSDSILESADGTNVEFADALDGIADRVEIVAADLASGNAVISFVVFGRGAVRYPANCARLELHEDPAAIARFEACLRSIAGEYRAGFDAPVRDRINTAATDHVAALVEAAELLPDTSSRAAVIFFTDGEHDPPGTARDNENVVARVRPAFEGRTPLAVLPVGLGSGAGAFEADLAAIYQAFFRDMEPCAGRASFAWPEVVFPSADAAGTAVALALQEVTCSFTVAPTPTPTQAPTPTPVALGQPIGVRVLAADRSVTVQWLPPSTGAEQVTDYLVHCTAATGGDPIESEEGISTEPQAEVAGLEPGVGYSCEVAATDGVTIGPWSAASAAVVVLGIPNAPSQPRVEALDSAARLTVDPAVGPPVEQYIYECTTTPGGAPVQGAGSSPTVVVGGLTNGVTYQCVAYAESSVGRSPASPASASFSPCTGLFGCNPWATWVVYGLVLAALLGAAALVTQRYKRRNRAWITAQVDGGENRPLGWGPELGIRLAEDEDGWFATPLPPEGAAVRVRYRGENRFVVTTGTRAVDIHQGDATSVRDDAGEIHTVTLRRYRDQPRDRTAPRTSVDTAGTSALQSRLGAPEDDAARGPEPPG
ncbi:MAG TPA: fibronectin type III domain-containing protein [Candidatus Limnocylindria bacterium]|nr:fibronectin type III domain-containing protein [Candidatus Limnocylindria bacterium]